MDGGINTYRETPPMETYPHPKDTPQVHTQLFVNGPTNVLFIALPSHCFANLRLISTW